jgi:hypothetical protein
MQPNSWLKRAHCELFPDPGLPNMNTTTHADNDTPNGGGGAGGDAAATAVVDVAFVGVDAVLRGTDEIATGVLWDTAPCDSEEDATPEAFAAAAAAAVAAVIVDAAVSATAVAPVGVGVGMTSTAGGLTAGVDADKSDVVTLAPDDGSGVPAELGGVCCEGTFWTAFNTSIDMVWFMP